MLCAAKSHKAFFYLRIFKMRKYVWALITCLCGGLSAIAQTTGNVSGNWYGILKTNQEKLRCTIHLSQKASALTGTIAFPDKSEQSRTFDSASLKNGILFLQLKAYDLVFVGKAQPEADNISGRLIWGNIKENVTLTHKEIKAEDLYERPQEPKPPFQYRTEELTFLNEHDSVRLAGTLTLPAGAMGDCPVIVMISGAGQQNRDNEIARHKMFLVMADYFAKHGIATLRYDDRGVGGSGGDADTTDIEGYARDAAAAVRYLKGRKEVDKHNIGVLGFGEGSIAAQIVTADNPTISFMISMGGMGVSGREYIDQKMIAMGRAYGQSDAEIKEHLKQTKPYWDAWAANVPYEQAKANAEKVLEQAYETLPKDYKQGVTKEQFAQADNVSPEMLSILRYQPVTNLKRIKCAFMAINGNNDLTVNADSNLKALEKGLLENGNNMVTVRKFAGLNHLFQQCKTCTEDEYVELEQTIDPLVPEFITHWVLQLIPSGR